MMKAISTVLLIALTIFLSNCGGFKVEAGLDDATLEKIDSIFGDNTEDSDSDNTDQADTEAGGQGADDQGDPGSTQTIKDDTGAIFVGSYNKWADTCYNFNVKDNVRVFETDEDVLFYNEAGPDAYLIATKYSQDSTLDLVIPGSFGNDDLQCLCQVGTDASITCSCENTNTDCAIIWGQI